jgi:hypothetical protein
VSYKAPANVANHFASSQQQTELQKEVQANNNQNNAGSYSIPVRIENSKVGDPTLSKYETPSFIHKSEKQIPIPNGPRMTGGYGVVEPKLSLYNEMNRDIKAFSNQFDHAHDMEAKIKISK